MEEPVKRTFTRYEKKLRLTEEQCGRILPALSRRLRPDEFDRYTVCNLYYDTENYDLIRRSLDNPAYREKFRLRCYVGLDHDDLVFAEIKKKYRGIVYKRRMDAPDMDTILAFIRGRRGMAPGSQEQNEIRWFLTRYSLQPKVFISYDRTAMTGTDDPDLRITFDRNILWRAEDTNRIKSVYGRPLLDGGSVIMEIKVPYAIPLWLARLLSENGLYPSGFSKYGYCYSKYIIPELSGNWRFSHA